jgi:hypothetical protein
MILTPALRRALPFLVALAFPAAGRGAEKAEPVTVSMLAESATAAAVAKLKADTANAVGTSLLALALALDPEHKDALLLQAKVERKLPIDTDVPANAETAFVEQALAAAKSARSDTARLLLYRVADLVRPGDEAALVALAKARNDGVDTRFESLLAAFVRERSTTGKSRTVDISLKEPWPFKMPVTKGDRFRIVATGTWRVLPRGKQYGPDSAEFYLQGRLGSGEPFRVGAEYTLVVREEATLHLGMREDGIYSNNSGKITVTIERLR